MCVVTNSFRIVKTDRFMIRLSLADKQHQSKPQVPTHKGLNFNPSEYSLSSVAAIFFRQHSTFHLKMIDANDPLLQCFSKFHELHGWLEWIVSFCCWRTMIKSLLLFSIFSQSVSNYWGWRIEHFHFAFIQLQSSLIIIHNFTIEANPDCCNISVGVYNDGVHSSAINLTWDISRTIETMIFYTSLYVQQDENDKECKKEFLRTTINAARMFKGLKGNVFADMIMSSLKEAMRYAPSIPWYKVKLLITFWTFLLTFRVRQGHYEASIQSVPDTALLALIPPTRGVFKIRSVGRLEKRKKPDFIALYTVIGEITRN